eukprot:353707-Chlamydomonas_euryale.AAC.1
MHAAAISALQGLQTESESQSCRERTHEGCACVEHSMAEGIGCGQIMKLETTQAGDLPSPGSPPLPCGISCLPKVSHTVPPVLLLSTQSYSSRVCSL